MTASDLVSRLHLPSQTRAALAHTPVPEHGLELKCSFFQRTPLFQKFAEADDSGLSVLRLYLDWLGDTKAQYDSRNIPEKYFWDSMGDLAIWCEDYLKKHGTAGFQEWEWVGYSLRLEVIRIGRLQFEPSVLRQPVTLDYGSYPAGTPVLNVHIPAGEPLRQEEVLASMQQAPDFFRRYFQREFSLLHCHSWLLSPALQQLLPADSRILQFQNLFTLYKTDEQERQTEERVFGFLSENVCAYPENTSLQRAVKNHLLAGKTVPMGAGVREV